MVLSGWRALLALVFLLVVVSLLLVAAFWFGVLLAAVGAVVWLNLQLLPRLSVRLRVPQLVLALSLLPVLAAVGLALGGGGGLMAGCSLWVLGVALPRAALRWLRSRNGRDPTTGAYLNPQAQPPRIIDTTFSTR
jgi:hypothetical protein